MILKKRAVIILLIMLIAWSLPSYGYSEDMVYVEHSLPESFNPITANDPASLRMSGLIYSGLVQYHLGASIEPVLVASGGDRPPGNDYLSIESCSCVRREDRGGVSIYSFSLRKDIFWHNGQRLTAEDVKATYDWVKGRSSAYSFLLKFYEGMDIDGDTMSFRVRKGINPLELFMMPVLPRSYIESGNANKLSGTGYYKIGDSKAIDRIFLNRHIPEADLKKPVSTIALKKTTEGYMDTNALISGNIHFIPELKYMYVPKISENPSIRLYPYWVNNIMAIAINMRKAGLNDQKVREALLLALDRKSLVEKWFPTSRMISGPITPGHPFYIDVDVSQRDVKKAKDLIKASKFRSELILKVPLSSMNDIMFVGFINDLIRQWDQAGIRVKLQKTHDDKFKKEVLTDRQFELALVSTEFSRTFYINPLYTSNAEQNITGYSNPQIDKLFARAVVSRDLKELRSIYANIQDIISGDVPYIYMIEEKKYAAYHTSISTKGLLIPDNIFGLTHRWEISR